jgi:hypothetical protein
MRAPAEDPSAADWLGERLLKPRSDPEGGNPVGAIVPAGFDAYARVFHEAAPATGFGPAVRWSDVAASTGRIAHPLMEWHRIVTPAPGSDRPPWDPGDGAPIEEPSRELVDELAALLGDFTSTPQDCWFCRWEGYGGEHEDGAQVKLPDRDYVLSFGPVDAVTSFDLDGHWRPPNIWWPEDRAWCVASEVDLLTTYVGGSAPCIERLLSSRQLEAMRTSSDARVDYEADVLNRD